MEIPVDVLKKKTLMEGGVDDDVKERKTHQPPLSVEEQVNNLKKLNLIIDDDERVTEVLNRVSYFRLVKAYGVGLKSKNNDFDGSVKFDDLVALYDFDTELRQLLIAQIEKVEITFRCRLANYFCLEYGVVGYLEKDNFADGLKWKKIIDEIFSSIGYNKRSPFVRNFQDNYEGGDVPFYALVEILSFGTLSKFYKNMKNTDKKQIAKMYENNWPYLESWFESLAYVRNICAHYGRIYNVRLDKTPRLPGEYKDVGVANNRIFGVICCMNKLLPNDNDWVDFVSGMKGLLLKYPKVDSEKLGFPENWQELLMMEG